MGRTKKDMISREACMDKIAEYFSTNGAEYLQLLREHMEISGSVVLLAMILAIPMGILCSHFTKLQLFLERFFGVLRIIPGLAVLLLCIPVMGTGVKPAVTALTILAIPPILMNTVQGFQSLPKEILEAAEAMGMSRRRCFFQVRLPLAFPIMYAGIRTAAVEVIASATLASYIGAGGLGDIIFTGLGLMRMDLLYIGGVSVAVLSLLTGYVLDRIYRYQTRYLCN